MRRQRSSWRIWQLSWPCLGLQIKIKIPGLKALKFAIAYNIPMQKLRSVIGPSILSADFANLQADCQHVLDSGADSLHIDIMDGHFVNNLTLGPPIVAALRAKFPNTHLDCHLMVTNPESYIKPLAQSKVNCFTFHYEVATNNLRQLCEKVRASETNVGVSIKPATQLPPELISLAEEGLIDKILVMTVEPGFGGQKFMEDMMPKVKQIRQKLPNIDIQVDGGLNLDNIQLAVESGANCIVAGSSIFKAKDRKEVITQMKAAFGKKE